MAICDLDVAPAFERSKHHEEIGGAIALVLVIETGRASRFHRDRHARFGNELLRGLVEANQRTIAVAWPRVDGQHVFHSGYERAVGLRRDDPVLTAIGLKSDFLSARPIVLSLARSTMPSSTTLFSNSRKVQRARPLGGLEQAKQGRALAERMCSACHAVGRRGKSPHVGAPPFRVLGRRVELDTFTDRLREGLRSDHPDMPTFRFTREDARALLLYLRSIQAP